MDLQYNYEELASAIILRAADDYRAALKGLKANPRNWRAKAGKDDIERFFRSGWFSVLTSVDGEMLIRSLQMEVDA